MATKLDDITRRTAQPAPAQKPRGEDTSSPESPNVLPLGICGQCEHDNFTAFRAADPFDETVWKSPDRRRWEAGAEKPRRFRCRVCGRVVELPEDAAAQTKELR